MDALFSQSLQSSEEGVYRLNEVSANVVLLPDMHCRLLSEERMDGATLAFASRMDEEGAIPSDCIEAMFAVMCVCKSESSVDDIIEDEYVRLRKKKKDKIDSKTQRQAKKQKLHPYRNANTWDNLDHNSMGKELERLRDPDLRRELLQEYNQGTNNPICDFEEHRMYLTVHEVKENVDDSRRSFFCVVLWVVFHKNFDFVGKLERMCMNPNIWRNAEITPSLNNRVENNISSQEILFQVWKRVYYNQINITPGGNEFARHMQGSEGIFSNISNPDSFASIPKILNPLVVAKKIMLLRPRDWDAAVPLVIEGLDYVQLEEDGVFPAMYTACFRARQLQFERCRRAIKRREEQEKQLGKKRGNARGEGDGGEEIEALDATVDGEADVDLEYEYCPGQEPVLFDVFDMEGYGKKDMVTDALTPGCRPFDENGVARIPYAPAWVLDTFDTLSDDSQQVTLVSDDIPRCEMRHIVDMACISRRIQKMIAKVDLDEFKLHFGHFPSRTYNIIKNRKWGIHNESSDMIIDEGPGRSIALNERETLFDRQQDVLSGYIFDSSYSITYERMEKYAMQNGDPRDNIGLLRRDLEKRYTYMRADILSKKMVAPVFESTIRYVQFLDSEYIKTTRGKFYDVIDSAYTPYSSPVGSDFEWFHHGLDTVMADINAMAFKLRPANLDFLYSLFESEILWRCGTYGNWTWMGMTISVCDAAGLTECKMNNTVMTNMKKAGTCGFDFTVRCYLHMRKQIYLFVPESVFKQFTFDGQMPTMQSKATVGSIVDGFKIIQGGVVPPSSSVGTPRVYSEGCGENANIMNALVSAIPRDDNIEVEQETTVDLSKNGGGVRQMCRNRPLVGSSTVILAFGENQQTSLEYVRRKYDLMRAITIRPASLPCQRMVKMQSVKQGGVAEAFHSDNVIFSNDVFYGYAPFTSNIQLISTVSGFLQKFGAIRWDVGDVVQFSMNLVKNVIDQYASSIISPTVKKHLSRKWKIAQATAGVARTVWVRTLEACIEGECSDAFDAALKVARLQSCDALHISLLSNVAMRYLTQILDFQSLAILRVLFEDAAIPHVSPESAFQFACGKDVASAADKQKISDYTQASFRSGNFAPKTEFGYADRNDDENITPYVAPLPSSTSKRCGRMKEDDNPNYRGSLTEKREASLLRNFVDVAGGQLSEYSGFSSDSMETWILSAFKRLATASFDTMGFYRDGQKECNLRRVFQKLFGGSPSRFRGLLNAEERQPILKMCRMPNADIAWCVYFPDALVLRSLMGRAGCDWELQVEVAKAIVKRTLSGFVPYALFPVVVATFDNSSFTRNPTQIRESITKHGRPLCAPRNAADFLPHCRGAEGDGRALYEDFAHMHSVVYMAKKSTGGDIRALDLCQWDFDVWWGTPGDVTPLWQYYCPQCEDSQWCAAPGRKAYVKVNVDNMLELVVCDSDGRVVKTVMESPGSKPLRRRAQTRVFSMGWGPAFKWTRTGVVFTHNGLLSTLVPFNWEDAAVQGLDGSELVWFNEVSVVCCLCCVSNIEHCCDMQDRMSYLAKRSDGVFVEVDYETVYCNVVKYKTPVLFKRSRVVLNDGERFLSSSSEDSEWALGYFCPDLGSKSSVCKISVVVKHYALDGMFFALHPEDFDLTFPMDETVLYSCGIGGTE